MKNIVANNPVAFLSEFTNLVRDGWVLNPNDSVVMFPRYETSLVKQKDDLPQLVEFKPNATELVVEAPSFGELCEKLQFFLNQYWELDYSSLNANLAGMSSVRVWREKHLAVQNYSKEELQNMEWEQLKLLARSYNCFNRNKDICIYNIIKQQEGK